MLSSSNIENNYYTWFWLTLVKKISFLVFLLLLCYVWKFQIIIPCLMLLFTVWTNDYYNHKPEKYNNTYISSKQPYKQVRNGLQQTANRISHTM